MFSTVVCRLLEISQTATVHVTNRLSNLGRIHDCLIYMSEVCFVLDYIFLFDRSKRLCPAERDLVTQHVKVIGQEYQAQRISCFLYHHWYQCL